MNFNLPEDLREVQATVRDFMLSRVEPRAHEIEETNSVPPELLREAAGLDWTQFALRFSAYAPGVHSAIVGTASIENLERNVRIVQEGPLPLDVLTHIEAAWRAHGTDWGGEV